MLTGAAICPSTPLLLRGTTGQLSPEMPLRRAALESIGAMIETGCTDVVVVGAGEQRSHDAIIGVSRFGGLARNVTNAPVLPVALAVGVSLLGEAGWHGTTRLVALSPRNGSEQANIAGTAVRADDSRTGLLVVGSASACTTDKAPGGFREDAAEFNEAVLAAVLSIDPAAIVTLDAERFDEQLSDLRLPLIALLATTSRTAHVTLHWNSAPFGVHYICASITEASGTGPT